MLDLALIIGLIEKGNYKYSNSLGLFFTYYSKSANPRGVIWTGPNLYLIRGVPSTVFNGPAFLQLTRVDLIQNYNPLTERALEYRRLLEGRTEKNRMS